MFQVFGKPPLVDEVQYVAYATEIGEKYKKAHFNLQVDIWHYVQYYSIHKLRKRMKKWLKQHYKPNKNWNVFISLINRKRTNYSNKDERKKAYARYNTKPELQEELHRLSEKPTKKKKQTQDDDEVETLANTVNKISI